MFIYYIIPRIPTCIIPGTIPTSAEAGFGCGFHGADGHCHADAGGEVGAVGGPGDGARGGRGGGHGVEIISRVGMVGLVAVRVNYS